MTETKQCTGCLKNKPLTDFHRNSANEDRLAKKCKKCVKAQVEARAAEREPVAPDTPLTCSKCGNTKLAAEGFYAHPTSKTGYNTTRCKACSSTYYKAGRSDDLKLSQRDYQLQRNYGVTAAWYDEQLAAQGGHCAMCPATEPGHGWAYFAVDHDHATGAVRELLCADCNFMLGRAHDDEERLLAGVAYLRKHKA